MEAQRKSGGAENRTRAPLPDCPLLPSAGCPADPGDEVSLQDSLGTKGS